MHPPVRVRRILEFITEENVDRSDRPVRIAGPSWACVARVCAGSE